MWLDGRIGGKRARSEWEDLGRGGGGGRKEKKKGGGPLDMIERGSHSFDHQRLPCGLSKAGRRGRSRPFGASPLASFSHSSSHGPLLLLLFPPRNKPPRALSHKSRVPICSFPPIRFHSLFL